MLVTALGECIKGFLGTLLSVCIWGTLNENKGFFWGRMGLYWEGVGILGLDKDYVRDPPLS